MKRRTAWITQRLSRFWSGRHFFIIPLIGLAALGLLLAAERRTEWVAVEKRESERLIQSVNIVVAGLSRQLQVTDRALEVIRNEARALLARPEGVTLLDERLTALVPAMVGVRTLLVVDRDGAAIASNRRELVGMNFRDSERYATIRQGGDPSLLYVSAPFRTPLGVWSVSLGRMLPDAHGRFDGYVLAILDPDYFDELVRAAFYAPDMRAGVIHSDGRFVLQIPSLGATGLDVSKDPRAVAMRHLASGQQSTLIEAVTAADQQLRLVANMNVRSPQVRTDKFLFVGLSRETDAIFVLWRWETRLLGGLYGALCLLTLTGVWLLQRYRIARAQSAVALEHERTRREQDLQALNETLEQRVQERTAALQQSEANLQIAQAVAHIGSWWLQADTEHFGMSRETARIFELEDTGATTFSEWVARIHPEDQAKVEQEWRAALAGAPYDITYRLLVRGRVTWIRAQAELQFDAGGKLIRAVGTVHDITDRKAAEQALVQAKAAADVANVAKSMFLAHMSHEIRTPMNAVINIARLLQDEVLTPEQRELVSTIDEAGQSLLRIINDILDFSKIEAGQLAIEQRPFELAVLLNRVESLLRGAVDAKGLSFTIVAPCSSLRPLVGDTLRLEQVLVNLINNAIKFTRQGGITLNVGARDESASGVRLRFEVRDTGIGIAPEAIATLFQPFTQADSGITRRFGGTGLGLAICRRVVELMGGEIGVFSTLGEGSTFWFELQYTWAEAEPRVTAPASETGSTGPQLAGLRVLVADDNKMNLLIVDKILKSQGAATVFAADGQQALQILQASPQGFDVVLMDIQMPVMDGLTATQAIRADPALTHLPVIALTAGVLEEERERALAAGVDGFLPKPLDRNQMIGTLLSLRAGRPRSG